MDIKDHSNLSKKTAIIYSRVSSQEQVQGTSLAMQERLCKEYAERENLVTLKTYIEEGESAKTADRTEFQKALAFCANKKPKVDFFIVHKVDRFARNQADHVVTRALLKKYGTELRSVTEPISDDPVGKAMEGMLAVFAEFDNNVRAARSKSGMAEKVSKGIWVWSAPIGYKRLIKGGNLVIDDDKAPFIRMAFEEYAKGVKSYQALADFLFERGFRTRTGKKPCQQLIEKIIHNPIYYAKIKVWGHEYDAAFAPIVSEELFWKCQPGAKNNYHSGKRIATNPAFPLRRFATCPLCGHGLTGSFSTGSKGVKYPYYHHQKQNCPAASFIPKETLEQNFVEYLQSVTPNKKYEKLFKAIVLDVWQTNFKNLDAENERIRKDVKVLEDERQRVFDFHRMGKYTDAEFLEQKENITIKISQRKLLLDEKRIEEFNMDEALDYCFRFVNDTASVWVRLEKLPAQRIRFQKTVFPEKVTFDGEKFGNEKMSLVYEINRQSGDDSSNLVTPPGIEPGLTA